VKAAVHSSPTRPRATDDPDAPPVSRVRPVVDALRPHQWVKNLLLVVPPVAAHRFDAGTAGAVALAFVSLSLCASGGYVLNDLLDLSADRQHHRKRHRPFASGRLSIRAGVLMIAACWAAGLGIALTLLPPLFVALTIGYMLCTAAYSLWLKREPVLDVMFLAGLYVVRVIAGGAATEVPVSTWFLAFTLFVCLSLAFLKRFIEVHAQRVAGTDAPLPGRGYVAGDAPWLQSAGLTSAYLAVVVLAIYVNNADVTRLYAHPQRLLLVCPVLLFWATRSWLLAHRRKIHDDPVVAVAADPVTYVLGAIVAVIVFSAV
jgi:4-hydroxybenzoate polyprenyltransferase